MHKLIPLICSAALMLGCSQKDAVQVPAAMPPTTAVSDQVRAPAPSNNTLSADAIGKVKFGSKLADVEATLKEKATGPHSSECVYVQFAAFPTVHFMVENGVIMRADIKAGPPKGQPNITGINAGDDVALLKAKYPTATVTRNKYVETGHDIRIAGPANSALIFEDDGKKITSVRGGLEPAVSYSEGCS